MIILKWLIKIEYILGFVPTMFIFYILYLFGKPKNDKEFYKRALYIQVFVFPSIVAGLIIFIDVLFQSIVVAGIMNFFSLFYILGIIYFQYKDDDYVNLVSNGDQNEKKKLRKRLIIIKCIIFFLTIFIIGFFIPHHYIAFMVNH